MSSLFSDQMLPWTIFFPRINLSAQSQFLGGFSVLLAKDIEDRG
jgi:hypothetical protein